MGMKDILRMALGMSSLYDAGLGGAGKHFEHKDTSKRKAIAKRRKKNKKNAQIMESRVICHFNFSRAELMEFFKYLKSKKNIDKK